MVTSIRLKTSTVINLSSDVIDQEKQQQKFFLPLCNLQWKRKLLWVKQVERSIVPIELPALNSEQWLIDCLKQSSVKLVCLDLNIGEVGIKNWADACQQTNKKVFLKIPSNFKQQNSLSWSLKRILDWIAAAFLVLILSPLMILIALLIRLTSPGPIFFKQWRVGKRGQLFQIIKFRTMVINAEKLHHEVMENQQGLHKCKKDPRVTKIGYWLRKYSLDELPQLFNVLRGEMSLVGPRPWALYDALRLSPAAQKRLNALPGITGSWQVTARSNLLDLDAVTDCDLNYLYNWSLAEDLIILLMTIPKVILGFNAY